MDIAVTAIKILAEGLRALYDALQAKDKAAAEKAKAELDALGITISTAATDAALEDAAKRTEPGAGQ